MTRTTPRSTLERSSAASDAYKRQLSLCGDNAAMVGAQGYFEYVSGTRGDMTLNARATLDIDSVQ